MEPERLDWITISDLHTEAVIGIFKEERTQAQPVVLNVRLGLSTRSAGREQRISKTVDYQALSGQLRFLLAACRFRLLETAAETMAAYLLAPPALGERRAQIQRVQLELYKPRALPAPTTARLLIERDEASFATTVEQKSFGTVDVVCQTTEWGIYRLNVAPGREIPLHVHRRMDERELVLTSGLVARGRELAPGTAFHWPFGARHHYSNPTAHYQTILCVDSPAFIPEDEVEVSGEPTEITPEHFWPPRHADGWALPARE